MNALAIVAPSYAAPLDQWFNWLDQHSGDPDSYIKLWRNLCSETGWQPLLVNGELIIGTTDDSRVAALHWPRVAALVEHLDAMGMRPALLASLAKQEKRS